jgi:MYXO-CTERM domain-containing protein
MTQRKMLASVAVGLSLFVSASIATAQVSDSFTGAPGPIAGQTGGSGFSGAYSGAGNVVSPGLTYGSLAASGNKFATAGSNNGAFRTLAAPINTDAGTIYAGFLAAGGSGTLPDYAGISFYSGGTSTEELFLGKPFQNANYGFDVSGVAGGVGTGATPVTTATTLLVYKLDFTPAGDTVSLYVNPTPGGALPATPDATFAIPEDTFANTFTSIRLQSGEGAGGASPFFFDELRGGGSFASVTPVVPEPAALGLLSLGALTLLRRRSA